MDYFIYSGEMKRGSDLDFIEYIAKEQQNDQIGLFLVTPGGDPDAAYKIGRYLQDRYQKVTVIVPGLCKSAGTLLAIAAHELAFSPYGELGPLDIQMARDDKLTGLESGLNTSEAFSALEGRALDTFHNLVSEIVSMSNGVITFQTASSCANAMVAGLYGPIFANIDAEEVGSRSRAMRIGEDYGRRLNIRSENTTEQAIRTLAQTYPSHGFVIDFIEARALFRNVRLVNEVEATYVSNLGSDARFPKPSVAFTKLKPPQASEYEAKLDGNSSVEGTEDGTDEAGHNGPSKNGGSNGKASRAPK